ncbi:hypothetical protein EDB87DRAFT_1579909 [Lactarius vividus]|nr:hypothetical protein EDB87DRAFT_1579909 [Lactarius vividus]
MLVSPLRVFAVLVAATVAGVSAQNVCVTGCVQQAESPSTCTSYTDLTCVCSNKAFQSAAATCLNTKCTTADQQAALALQKQNCGFRPSPPLLVLVTTTFGVWHGALETELLATFGLGHNLTHRLCQFCETLFIPLTWRGEPRGRLEKFTQMR